MPLHKLKAVTVRIVAKDDDDESFLVVPIETTGRECLEWVMSDGEHPLPVMCIAFSAYDAEAIARLWNEEAARTTTLESMTMGGSA